MNALRCSLYALLFGALAVPAIAAGAEGRPDPLTDPGGEVRMVEPIYAKHAPRFEPYGGPGPYFPERAARFKVSGSAVIQCRLRATGLLEDCELISETPGDYGFGEASLRMAKGRSMGAVARLVDGQRVDGETVRLKVPFNAPKRGY